jgi:hypothetical protein
MTQPCQYNSMQIENCQQDNNETTKSLITPYIPNCWSSRSFWDMSQNIVYFEKSMENFNKQLFLTNPFILLFFFFDK